MVERINRVVLGWYVRATTQLRSATLTRDEVGQAFTDYLIVIALIALLIVTVTTPAKAALGNVVDGVIGGVGSLVKSAGYSFGG